MYVFLRTRLLLYIDHQFSKSWTSSFLPYPCSCAFFICFMFFSILKKHKTNEKRWYQPLCVSFYYIIYIVNICIFEYLSYSVFLDANFQKAGRLHSCLITFAGLTLYFCFVVFYNKKKQRVKVIPTPVCFFLFYYIIINNMYVTQKYFPSYQKSALKVTSFFITRVDIMKPRKWWFFRTPAGALA